MLTFTLSGIGQIKYVLNNGKYLTIKGAKIYNSYIYLTNNTLFGSDNPPIFRRIAAIL